MCINISPEDLRKVQLVQLEILIDFDRICKKHNINYQLFAGTLLGAIRHNGFIPWDDDVDVCMLRSDYEKFLNVSEKELNKNLFLQNYETDKNYPLNFAKIRRNNTLYVERDFQDIDMHHGIYIDIFPFDNIKPDALSGKIQRVILYILFKINSCRSKIRNNFAKKKYIKNIRMVFYYILKLFPQNIINKLSSRISTLYNKSDTSMVGELGFSVSKDLYKRFSVKKEVFHDTIDWEFEGYKLPIPREYDYVLSNNYGEYMELPPKDKQKPCHKIIKLSYDTTK